MSVPLGLPYTHAYIDFVARSVGHQQLSRSISYAALVAPDLVLIIVVDHGQE